MIDVCWNRTLLSSLPHAAKQRRPGSSSALAGSVHDGLRHRLSRYRRRSQHPHAPSVASSSSTTSRQQLLPPNLASLRYRALADHHDPDHRDGEPRHDHNQQLARPPGGLSARPAATRRRAGHRTRHSPPSVSVADPLLRHLVDAGGDRFPAGRRPSDLSRIPVSMTCHGDGGLYETAVFVSLIGGTDG